MKNIRRFTCALFCFVLVITAFAGLAPLSGEGAQRSADGARAPYRDIPGVTAEDIAAVEALREQYPRFVYGMLPSTEAFMRADGTVGGFGALVCEWLTEMFGIPFELEIMLTADQLGIVQRGEVDFTGDIRISDERREYYYATDPIALRSMIMIRHKDSPPIRTIAATRLPRYMLIRDTISVSDVAAVSEPGSYEEILIDLFSGVATPMLLSGEADALVILNIAEGYFRNSSEDFAYYDDHLIIEDFFPPIFSPVNLITGKQDLIPIISVVQKALEDGAIQHLNKLYARGYKDYKAHELYLSFTEEEAAFIQSDPVILLAAEFDNYPVSFYSDRYQQWRGITLDVLSEVEQFTGLKFEVVNSTDTQWSELMRMTEDGEAHIITDLMRTEDREGRFLWANINHLPDQSALISRSDLQDISSHDILTLKVGITKGTAHVDLFRTWFPGHGYVTEYESNEATLDALTRGEVDVVMSKSSLILQLTHYYELPGYKIAYLFDNNLESAFGFNAEQEILQSIVSKALKMVDMNEITGRWMRRTYDYRTQLAQAQRPWIIGAVATLSLILVILIAVYIKDRAKNLVLSRMKARTDAILQNIPGMIFQQLYNPPEYTYSFVSEGCEELLGYSAEELMGGRMPFTSILHPDDHDHVIELAEQTLPLGLPFETTFRIITKDGTEKWIWERSRVIETHPDGSPKIAEGYYADVTESKKLEEAELENRARIMDMNKNMIAILDSMPVGIRVVSRNDMSLLYANKAVMGIIGADDFEKDIAGRNVLDFMPEIQPNGRTTAEMIAEFNKKSENTMDFQCVRKNGELFMARISGCRINYMGQNASLACLEDLTERNLMQENIRRAELAEASSNAKSQFLATMSHEIRTPMNSIMGFAELALDSERMAQIKDYLGKITDGTKWLLNIIDDILDISKIEAGKIELEQVPFNLYEIFARCQSVMLPVAKGKGLDLRVYAEPIPGKKLVGDQVRLYQALVNLLSNAVKFTDMGVVKFSSTVKSSDDGSALIYFEVRDSGIGMTREQVSKIFEPFTQADSSTTRNYGGTGLGLAITKGIIELMGGELHVDSAPGEGSAFSFEIAFETVDAEGENLLVRENVNLTQKPLFEGLILICDDNPMNREVICEHLSRVGIDTVVAENGKEGVEKVEERIQQNEAPFNLIFMDMFMPVMDGMEAAQKITQLNTGTPIVAMTANIMTSELEKYKKNGMPDCLGKPFTSQELWRVLLKYLTPISIGPIEDQDYNGGLQKKLRSDFVRNNRAIHKEIEDAAASGDLKLAHRLAHTLKGNAGLIGKPELRAAAEEVELLLRDGPDSIWESKMNRLKTELETVLEGLDTPHDDPHAQESGTEPVPHEQVTALFDKLAPMLENINPACFDLLGELRAIPGTETLAQQISDFDFEAAAQTLEALRAGF
ncbi:MAG: ATP-binding protein [Oscillospiraceae bacterium]|nr:ATP-binding protein [Oscillospiraceae bacterium]